jgi:hypothetical protein
MAIAEKIAVELGFSEENTEIFVSGSIGPDSHADFPHKTGKDQKILSKIDVARTLFLQNDEYAYGELGNALHYIQDKWVSDESSRGEVALIVSDDLFLESIKQSSLPDEAIEEYLKVADALLTVKNRGIESWFNHSWGIWHKDYASCIYVFTDVVELMLPTLQPDNSIRADSERLKEYVRSKAFENAIKKGFFASVMTNFLYPKLTGYPAAMYFLALLSPPASHGNKKVFFNIVYRLSLEIARNTLVASEFFKFQDSWTHRTETNKQSSLASIVPQYHVLIPKPLDEVQQQRRLGFCDENRLFLEEWPSIEQTLPTLWQRSETWKIILSELVQMLRTE